MTLDAELLEILVCPNDRGEVDYLEDEQVIVCSHVRLSLSGSRRHPGHAHRRGREARVASVDRPRRCAGRPLADPQRHARRRASACRGTAERPTIPPGLAEGPALRRRRHQRDVLRDGRVGASPATSSGRCIAGPAAAFPIEVVKGSPVLPGLLRSAYAGGRLLVLREHGGDARRVSRSRSAAGAASLVVTSGGTSPTRPPARVWPLSGCPAASCRAPPSATWRSHRLGALEATGTVARRSRRMSTRGRRASCERPVAELGPERPRADNAAKSLALRIGDRSPVIWGADGIGAVAAARWKTQLNENAKVPAFCVVDARARPQRGRGMDRPVRGTVLRGVPSTRRRGSDSCRPASPCPTTSSALPGRRWRRSGAAGYFVARSVDVAHRRRRPHQRLPRDLPWRRSHARSGDRAPQGRTRRTVMT